MCVMVIVESARHVAAVVAARLSTAHVSEDARPFPRTTGACVDEGHHVVSHSCSWQRS